MPDLPSPLCPRSDGTAKVPAEELANIDLSLHRRPQTPAQVRFARLCTLDLDQVGADELSQILNFSPKPAQEGNGALRSGGGHRIVLVPPLASDDGGSRHCLEF